MRRIIALAAALAGAALPVAAQDSVPQPGGVRLTLRYDPGNRPSLVIVPGAGLDSVRTIFKRDLDFSDRFQTIITPEPDAVAAGAASPLNYGLYKNFGAAFALGARADGRTDDGAPARREWWQGAQHDGHAVRRCRRPGAAHAGASRERRGGALGDRHARRRGDAHRIRGGGPHHADGFRRRGDHGPHALGTNRTVAGLVADLRSDRVHAAGRGQGAGADPAALRWRTAEVPGSESALNITPMFSPDGQFVAYAQSGEQGTNIQVANVRDMCCVQRLTTGRFADNLSPTYAPDGQRIAFVSTRAGPPQIYVMEANGTNAELLVPFDFGVTGSSNAPEWSPDGVSLAFHREVSGGPQIFVLDVAGRRLKQLSSSGRNEDPTWAPDGRHIAFVSDRTGQRQIWVIDIETGRVRAITTGGVARLPAWSRRLP